jgi:hypothetical protein
VGSELFRKIERGVTMLSKNKAYRAFFKLVPDTAQQMREIVYVRLDLAVFI